MLKPSECFAGSLANATQMSLFLPRREYERSVLVAPFEDKMHAIVLTTGDRFTAFECTGNTHWNGLIVPNVDIELDETAVFDPSTASTSLGAMIRQTDQLIVSVHFQGSHPALRASLLPVLTNLPPCADRSAAGFLKWQIVLGVGQAKRVLFTIDVATEVARVA